MNHSEKVEYLLQDLEGRGLNPFTIAPPIYRAMWKLGLKVPPPLFQSFAVILVSTGAFFAVFWGILGFMFRRQITLGPALFAGFLFGLWTAFHSRRKAKGLELPRWEDYPDT